MPALPCPCDHLVTSTSLATDGQFTPGWVCLPETGGDPKGPTALPYCTLPRDASYQPPHCKIPPVGISFPVVTSVETRVSLGM